MSPPRRTRAHLRDQRGFAIPITLIVLMIMLALVGAAALAAVSATNVSRTNVNAVRAQQAADAGLRVALYEYSSLAVDSGTLFAETSIGKINGECYKGSSNGVETPELAGEEEVEPGKKRVKWCVPVTNSLGDGVRYSYVISPANQIVIRSACDLLTLVCEWESTVTRTVVATGTAGNETRVAKEEAQMKGISYKSCSKLALCELKLLELELESFTHTITTQYYASIPGSYRQCSKAAAQEPIGKTLPGQEPKC